MIFAIDTSKQLFGEEPPFCVFRLRPQSNISKNFKKIDSLSIYECYMDYILKLALPLIPVAPEDWTCSKSSDHHLLLSAVLYEQHFAAYHFFNKDIRQCITFFFGTGSSLFRLENGKNKLQTVRKKFRLKSSLSENSLGMTFSFCKKCQKFGCHTPIKSWFWSNFGKNDWTLRAYCAISIHCTITNINMSKNFNRNILRGQR